MVTTSTFRGYHAINEVVERMKPLAEWLDAHRRAGSVLTLRRRDLDLLRRWPKAADLFGIYTTGAKTWWRGFELRADHSPPRYPTQDES